MNDSGGSLQPKRIVSIADILKQKRNQSDQVVSLAIPSTTHDVSSDDSDSESDSDVDTDDDSDALEEMVNNVVNQVENRGHDHHAGDNNENEDAEDEPILHRFPELPPEMWQIDRVFNSLEEAETYLKNEGCWSFRSSYTTKSGHTTLYRCNKVPFKGKQCAAEIRITCEIELDSSSDSESNEDEEIQEIQSAVPIATDIVEEQNEQPEQNQEQQGTMPVVEPNAQGTQKNDGTTIGKEIFKVFRKNRQHNHEELKQIKKKVKPEIAELVIQLNKHYKPKTIVFELRDRGDIEEEDIPSIRQVRNIIQNRQKMEYGSKPMTMRQLTEFVEKNMVIPESIDKAFILTFERSPSKEPNQYFRYFVTTKRLLLNAEKALNIHADGTYKITQEKLPLIVVGSTDMTRRFHLIGLVITSNETAADYEFTFKSVKLGIQKFAKVAELIPRGLVADADAAIHNGFRVVFPDQQIKIIMCFAHVMSNIQRKYKFNSQDNKQGIMEDVRKLHLAADERAFKMGCNLFMEKWVELEEEAVKKLQKSFFKKNYKWYIGAEYRIPKTNNALESFNASVKIFHTQFERKPLKQFKNFAMKIVEQRSKEYIADKEPFQSELNVSVELMRKGIAYSHANFIDTTVKENGEVDFFLFRSGINKEISKEDVDEFYALEYELFDDFVHKSSDIWKITFPANSENWKLSTCSCPAFDAEYICKHIVGIADQLGLIKEEEKHQEEENYDDVPLFASKRGRPKRASTALNKD